MLDDLMTDKPLKTCLQQVLARENLASQRALITTLANELNTNSLNCAAALLYLLQKSNDITMPEQKIHVPIGPLPIKMVRYRLAVGSQHHINLELLKQVLVEESGVDKNNINNINIQDSYTLIDLPDEMPIDIFQHLKSVEINQHKLDIRRVKNRHHKRRNHQRRGRQTVANKPIDQVISS
jgi:hypothetical protein